MSMYFINGENGDQVNCGSPSVLDNIFDGGGTVMAWIWPQNYGGAGDGRILDKSDNDAVDIGWGLLMQDGSDSIEFWVGFLNIFFQSWGGWRTPTDSMDGLLDSWVHVAVTYNSDSPSNNASIYLNGVSQSITETWTPAGSRRSDASYDLIIGNHDDLGRCLWGWEEDARMYNRILSANEIQTIHAAQGNDGIVDGLVARYLLDQGAEGVTASGNAVDASINKNNGSILYSPDWDDGIIKRRRV